MAAKFVYFFGGGKAEGNRFLKDLLGGKGANLHEMTNIGVPVPPGFTITTKACVYYFKHGSFHPGLKDEVLKNLEKLEKVTGKNFGKRRNPLLVSVRSGARVSMPGMMDTVLNLGLNDEALKGLLDATGDERFTYDVYRRFVQMFGDIVMGVPHEAFEEILTRKKKDLGVEADHELPPSVLKELVKEFKEEIEKKTGNPFPDNPFEQLWMAIEAVFKSWNNERAIEYRRLNRIPDDWGTAVNVQTMVFGNMGFDSATGVVFTRDPATGEKVLFGEYLPNAQGEDVVAGIRTPKSIKKLEKEMPEVYRELNEIFRKLEFHYRDMMDIEFTIERGKVYILQTRVGKRTSKAEVRIAVDMANECLISKEEAVSRVDPKRVEQLLHPMIDPKANYEVLVKGLPASPGAAWGKVVFDSEEAALMAENGESVILVRHETSPEDIKGMAKARGILTSRGGMTSHAAVVARGMGKPCVVGAETIEVDYERGEFRVNNTIVKRGDIITIDGSTGSVILGKVPTIDPEIFPEFRKLLEWADEIRWIGVRANADTPKDAEKAREFGAEGIGLARTEHMFFEGERIYTMQKMILARTKEEREKALSKLLPMQRKDFEGLFKTMDGFPVTIRTLDPPLHEFLPKTEEEIENLSKRLGIPVDEIKAKADALHELNPMLGHRGCRLGIVYPEITEMQVRAIFEAACKVKKEGVNVFPEIMIPLVSTVKELELQRAIVDKVAKEVMEKEGIEVPYTVGTMIELPRAAVTADEIAKVAEFFSFGTNDLTQTTFGFSRDDVGKFLPRYIEMGILEVDPFQALDITGVGELIRIGIEKGRRTRPELKVGICGEHGGESESVKFCHKVGMDYVSASPFRIPIARLAAAQAVIEEKRKRQKKPS